MSVPAPNLWYQRLHFVELCRGCHYQTAGLAGYRGPCQADERGPKLARSYRCGLVKSLVEVVDVTYSSKTGKLSRMYETSF